MAQTRYRLRSYDFEQVIEARHNPEGYKALKRIRANYPQFKYQRIKSGVQMWPDKTPILRILKIGETMPLTAQ